MISMVNGRYGPVVFVKNDTVIGASLIAYGEYFESEVEVFRLYCKEGDTVIDAGANIGTHTQALASIVGPKGRVVSVEPQKLMYMCLNANALFGGYLNVFPHKTALGKERKVIKVIDQDYSTPNCYGGYDCPEAEDNCQYVTSWLQVVKLDDLVGENEKVSFIKMDIEGHEADALRGAERTIKKYEPVLYIENDKVAKSQALIELLWSYGYNCYWHLAPFFNPNNFNKNQARIHEECVYYDSNRKQYGRNGVGMNMVCIPGGNYPLPKGVVEITDSKNQHPCEGPELWRTLHLTKQSAL